MNDERRVTGKPSKLGGRIAFLGGLLVVVSMAVLTHRYTHPSLVDQARIDLRKKTLAELKAANTNLWDTYAWQDQTKGLVRVPIPRAMELVEREWRNPAVARSNLIARAERAAALPKTAPRPATRDSSNPRP
jgi:hypothetical protein